MMKKQLIKYLLEIVEIVNEKKILLIDVSEYPTEDETTTSDEDWDI